jgi:hypothetical protein
VAAITAAPLLPVGRRCMTAAEIAAALGSARREGRDWRCNCPLHGGRSLTLRNGQGRLLVKCWAGCNSLDVLAELRGRGLIDRRGDGAEQAAPVIDRADVTQRIALARRIWDVARDTRGTPVARYFAGRGLHIMSPLSSPRWGAVAAPPGRYFRPGDGRAHRQCRRRTDRSASNLAH